MALLRQSSLLQSGCQQWCRQPAAVHGDKFAYISSLAIYWHSADDQRLLKVFAHPATQLAGLCWSPVDPQLVAFADAQRAIKLYNVQSDSLVHSIDLPLEDPVSHLSWATHHEAVLLLTAGAVLATWAYTAAAWRRLLTCDSPITCFQQSATIPRLAALGCEDGSLLLLDLVAAKVACTVRPAPSSSPCDVAFDPLSQQYLLVACTNGQLVVYAISDDFQLSQVSTLAKQAAAQRRAAFVPTAPGNFVTVSDKSGVLQVWNVSQQQPLETLATGQGPAQTITFFTGTSKALITFQDGTVMVYDTAARRALWRSEPGHTETIFFCSWAPHDPNLLATCSYDGTVRIWDVSSCRCKHVLVSSAPCGRASDNAASSKVPILYSCCWSPDGRQLAASAASGEVLLYEVAKGGATRRFALHIRAALHVSWCPSDPELLVSSSLDGTVVVFRPDGTKLKVLQHQEGVSCSAWHPSRPLHLATTSHSGVVRTWDLNSDSGSSAAPLAALEGHTRRSFGVSWSPLVPQLLLSASDDGTARVWDVDAGCCLSVLAGHSSRVRALCWHPDLPWLVFTGSWDASIRSWDWPRSRPLLVCREHHADVYGLDIHPARPWLLASASRDTTTRLWDLTPWLAAPLWAAGLAGQPLPRGQADEVLKLSAPVPILCGESSAQLVEQLGQSQQQHQQLQTGSASHLRRAAVLSQYFALPGAAAVMWQLAEAVAAHAERSSRLRATPGIHNPPSAALARVSLSDGRPMVQEGPVAAAVPVQERHPACLLGTLDEQPRGDQASMMSKAAQRGAQEALACGEAMGLIHWTRRGASLSSEAAHAQVSASQGRGLGASRRAAALEEAAQKLLLAGDLEQACQLYAELRQWDKALALAPAVSQACWAALMAKRADALAREGAGVGQLLPFMVAAGPGSSLALVQQLVAAREWRTAADVAAVHASGGFQHLSTFSGQGPPAVQQASLGLRRTTSGKAPLPVGSALSISPAASSSLGDRLPSLNSGTAPSGRLARAGLLPSLSITRDRTSSSGGAGLCVGSLPSPSTTAPMQDWGCGAGSSGSPHLAPAPGVPPAAAHVTATSSFDNNSSSSSSITQPEASGAPQVVAFQQLRSVRQQQASTHRAAGRGVLAACCCLAVDDVAGAAAALLGAHEPEQALGILLALGDGSCGHHQLLDQAIRAAAVRAELSGQWAAAAAVLQLLPDEAMRQAAQQMLVVRAEGLPSAKQSSKQATEGPDATISSTSCDARQHSAAGSAEAAERAAAAAAIAAAGGSPVSAATLRQHLGIPERSSCGLCRCPPATCAHPNPAVDATAVVRWQLLSGKVVEAATAAVAAVHELLRQLGQPDAGSQLTCGGSFASHKVQAGEVGQADSSSVGPLGVYGPTTSPGLLAALVAWQEVLGSIQQGAVEPAVWSQLFAANLLVGGLRAFHAHYWTVARYLMSRLRHWLEAATSVLPSFPLDRPHLRLLEAERLMPGQPAAARELLVSLTTAPDSSTELRRSSAALLEAMSGGASSAPVLPSADVVVNGGCLPSGAGGCSTSVISGAHTSGCGLWLVLEDGSSCVTLDEAVMLSHVMRCSPLGGGKALLV